MPGTGTDGEGVRVQGFVRVWSQVQRRLMTRAVRRCCFVPTVLLLVVSAGWRWPDMPLERMARGQSLPSVTESADPFPLSLNQAISRRCAQQADIELQRYIETGSQARLELTHLLLSEALELDADTLDLVRRQAEICDELGLTDEARSLRLAILRRDPTDLVNQFAVLLDRLDQSPGVEERLAACQRLVGPEAQRINAEVRSRIASHAAALCLEQARGVEYRRWIDLALALDPWNPDALDEISRAPWLKDMDPSARLELLLRAAQVDPFNVSALRRLAAEGKSLGAWRSAFLLEQGAIKHVASLGYGTPDDLVADTAMTACVAVGPERALEILSARHRAATEMLREQAYRAWIADGQTTERPDLASLVAEVPPNLDMIALVAATIAGDPVQADASLGRLVSQVKGVEEGANPARDWLMTLAGRSIEPADDYGDSAAPDLVSRLRGWCRLRAGDAQGALEALSSLADRDAAAGLGVLLAQRQLGRTRDAIRSGTDTALRFHTSVYGMWAAWEVAHLAGQPVSELSTDGRQLSRRLEPQAEMILDMLNRRQHYVSLAIEIQEQRPGGPFSSLPIEVRVRHDGRWPLAVGPGRFADSEVAVTLTYQLRTSSGNQQQSHVASVNCGRVFSLKPGQEVAVQTRADLLVGGLLMDQVLGARLQITGTAVLGEDAAPGYSSSSSAIWRRSGMVTRQAWSGIPSMLLPAEQWSHSNGVISDEPMFVQQVAMLGDQIRLGSSDWGAGVLEALTGDWDTLTDLQKAWALYQIPPADEVGDSGLNGDVRSLESLAMRDDGPLCRIAWMLTRARQADDPVIGACIRAGEGPAAAVAACMSRTLPGGQEPMK